MKSLFTHTSPNGARYFTHMVLNQSRIGVGYGTLTKVIAAAFDLELKMKQPFQVALMYLGRK